jgi:L-lysine exporter family protein LysE/ArgO
MHAYLSGFGLGFSLILAIGAQNAFVLKQGIKKEHVFIICLLCALSDALLITAGVLGFGYLVEQFPSLQTVARYGGFAFLTAYGLKSFWTAWSMSHELNPAAEVTTSLKKIVWLTLAFTWLNPHVYLDTVVLLGSVSTKFQGASLFFGLGAVSASFVFFFSLGYGARILTPVFQKPISWKILEFFIGIVMLTLAWTLIQG